MAELGAPTGAMLAIAAPSGQVQTLLRGDAVIIVGFNSPHQTVVAGEAAAVREVGQRAAAAGWRTTPLPVSHAFHTPLVAAAAPVLAEQLACEDFAPLRRRVYSTVTGALLDAHQDLRELFCRQVTSPVRFEAALAALLRPEDAAGCSEPGQRRAPNLLLETGPGSVLTGLVRDAAAVPVFALDAGGPSFRGLLEALGVAFAMGAPLRSAALFADRFTRPFTLDWKPKFFANPCELAPTSADSAVCCAKLRHGVTPLASAGGAPGQVPLPALAECGPGGGRSAEASPCPLLNTASPGEGPHQGVVARAAPIPTLELVRRLVAERAELPLEAVHDEHRMLNDLHLNSISVGQLIAQAARQLSLPRLTAPTDFANASVTEMACALDELKRSGQTVQTQNSKRPPPGVDIWIESFASELVETKPPRCAPVTGRRGQAPASGPGVWQVFAPANHPLAAALRSKLAATGEDGVLLCLPENPTEDHVHLLLAAARAALALRGKPRFVVVQHGWGAAGLARTLHLESPELVTCVVNVPPAHPRAVDWIIAEALSASGYTEAHYDAKGRRREPRLRWLPMETAKRSAKALPIGPEDVLLVTGGGKGIGAECALALGRAAGARVVLLGRSDPTTDSEVAANLARIAAEGIHYRYLRADVTDLVALGAALKEAEQELGPITALLHCAGANTPQLLATLEEDAFRRTLAPKIQGLRNVLAVLKPDQLRLFVAFGSIIGRAGLRGEADYATANEWLTAFTEQFQARHPSCRCLALEWSVWSGVGMGERLGRVESLIQQGIIPIPPDEGVRILLGWLQSPPPSVAVVVTGRFGQPPTLKLSEPELPLQRFLEKRRVYYPGVELIVDAELSVHTDLYLKEHSLQKQMLLPAVLGLEAMAQAAMALTESNSPPVFEQVELSRPVVVAENATATLRLAALRRGANLVEVCLRSEETDYHVDHFRALCRFGGVDGEARPLTGLPPSGAAPPLLDPNEHLYGPRLFHEGRFRRLRGYQWLTAKECVGEITPDSGAQWFGAYLPSAFVLGDPAARDASLHAIQACIPHQRILPTGIERLVIRRIETGTRFVRARQRSRQGNSFVYDLEVTDAAGEVVEQWQGVRLCAVETLPPPDAWPLALWAPYVERRLEELVAGPPVRVLLERDCCLGNGDSPTQRHAATDLALQQALSAPEAILRRPNGKPAASSGQGVSAAHAQDLTLAVAGPSMLACDLETVATRPDVVWRDLLGEECERLAARISQEANEEPDTANTRLWSVLECLKKAGLPPEGPLVLESTTADNWVLLRSGALVVATYAGRIQGMESSLVAAVALNPRSAQEYASATEEAVHCEAP
jgi:enediyne polyketide synthase